MPENGSTAVGFRRWVMSDSTGPLFDLLSRTWLPEAKHGLRTPGLLILSTVGLVRSIITGIRSVPVDEVAIATNREAILR